MTTDRLPDYLEATLADSYRKEIDQEENVWRSLPFFAATLALQLAGLAQVRDWAAIFDGPTFVVALALLCLAGFATFAALTFLAFSVWPADFRRVAREPVFSAYARSVRLATAASASPGAGSERISQAALAVVKAALAEQYAFAVDSNRLLNEARAKWRTRAGLTTLVSVFAVLALVALVMVSNTHVH